VNELSLADMVGGLPPQEPLRRSRRGSERRRKKRRRRTWLLVLVSLLVVGGAVGASWAGVKSMIAGLNQPTDYPGPGGARVEVTIPDGASGTAIGQVLQDKSVVLTVKGFVEAFGDNPNSAGIQPGTYAMKEQMRSSDAVSALLDEANRLFERVTIKEGARADDIVKTLAAGTKIPLAELKAALADPKAIGLPPEAQGKVEGWLFPKTYDVQPDTTATDLLRGMVSQTSAELEALGVPVAKRHAVLTKASLVQAEAKLPQDFPKIARVLENRLAARIPLQLDTTVHYATKKFTVATSIKDTQIDSPYNTYKVAGLPVGAIDNPGAEAIKAVLEPAAGPWLYFVAVNPESGLTKYATTAAEFAVIKAEYDAWAKAHPGQ
jgi:UPF0755 protein